MAFPLVLANVSLAGGAGKTTINYNLAYEISLKEKTVGIIDLDMNHSIEEFVGLEPEEDFTKTSWQIFSPDFDGEYNFKPILNSKNIFLLQGHPSLELLEEELSKRKRREYILQKVLRKYPLPYDVLIFDLPGGINLVTENILMIASHILLPIHVGVKSLTAAKIIDRLDEAVEELELEPPPKILGFLPNYLDTSKSGSRLVYQTLLELSKQWQYKLYPPLKYWGYINSAAIEGKALRQMRPSDPMNSVFSTLAKDILKS